jgi:hypothetical protein
MLDALVFFSPDAQALAVYVGGRLRVERGAPVGAAWPGMAHDYAVTMKALWPT